METARRQYGEIKGDEVGLFPCLWLGFAGAENRYVPWWSPAWHGTEEERRLWREGKIPKYADPLKPGQLITLHQCGGTACSHVLLAGVFLPLSTCTDKPVEEALLALTRKYFGDPFHGWDPNLDDLLEVRRDLAAIGPLDSTNCFRFTEEAFLTFSLEEETYRWIADRFSMVTEILDNTEYRPVETTKVEPLPGKDLEGFTQWMKGPSDRIFSLWLTAALVYENSD